MVKTKRFFLSRRNDLNMTEGSILKNLITFAVPLLIGDFFQQLYNMVDTLTLGNFGLSEEYSAVGAVGPITNILLGFFLGLSAGAGVVISQYYGANDHEKVHDSVHTSIAMTLVLGLVFTVVGVAMTPFFVRIMLRAEGGSNEIYPYAVQYLSIYFAGIIGAMIYNIGSGILRAIGDSARPFYYLVASSLVNIVLDLVFVIQFHMGAAGVAIATILSQFVSAGLVIIALLRTNTCVKLKIKEIRFHGAVLKKIIKVGIPSALQMALTSFSNVFVQSYIAGINPITEQTAHLGGWTTYSKLDQLLFLPIKSMALSASTFVGQNLGAGCVERAKKGARTAFLISFGITAFLIPLLMLFAPQFSYLFNKDEKIIECSITLLHTLTPFYLFCNVNQIFTGVMRGAGNSRAPMIIMLSSFVGFRQLYLWLMTTYISNDLIPVAMAYPAGWVMCATVMLIYYSRFKIDKYTVTK